MHNAHKKKHKENIIQRVKFKNFPTFQSGVVSFFVLSTTRFQYMSSNFATPRISQAQAPVTLKLYCLKILVNGFIVFSIDILFKLTYQQN